MPGDRVEPLRLTAVNGEPVAIPDSERLVHLQFRRFAGCPVCHLHLRSIVRRHGDITAAGIREVAVFASTVQELAPHADLPFPLIADPGRGLYRRFGIDASARALLHPSVWRAALRGLRTTRPGTMRPAGVLGLPGDFLIAPDATVLAVHRGRHAEDHWDVDDLLALAARTAPGPPPDRSDRRAGW